MITRFAPSPTGYLHLGNIRTALFNWFIAKQQGGIMQLRIEDTDASRNKSDYIDGIIDDLAWLGIEWQGSDNSTPYLQSSQSEAHQNCFEQLKQNGNIYPCFCTEDNLKAERESQLKKGQAPRYNGVCKKLSEIERQQRLASNDEHVWRFNVPAKTISEFTDGVHGFLSFNMTDFGDFIIRRSNGCFSFIYANAVDDGLHGVTHVFRGDDHLSNTARQLLILKALDMPLPQYGHLPLITGSNNKPLSKREGLSAVRDLKKQGYLPLAIHNYLSRVGHHYSQEGGDEWATIKQLIKNFNIEGLGKSAAKYDSTQLLQRQKEAVLTLTDSDFINWVGKNNLPNDLAVSVCVELFKNNVLFPSDAKMLSAIFEQAIPPIDENAQAVIDNADSTLFNVAYTNIEADNWKRFCHQIQDKTGLSGKSLFMPLRVALTGRTDGPPMKLIYPYIAIDFRRQRLSRYCQKASD